jgi:hypothetical protein
MIVILNVFAFGELASSVQDLLYYVTDAESSSA